MILALALAALLLLAGVAIGEPDPREIVQASVILAKIERGEPVGYYGVIIVGDLSLNGVELPIKHVERTEDEIKYYGLTEDVKIVESSISILFSEIRGDVNLGNAIFKEPINFVGTNFSGDAYFMGANFRGYADFAYANFTGDAWFWDANFSGDAYLRSATFSGSSSFSRANFRGYADFIDAIFSDDANFDEANFVGNYSGKCVYFTSANFGGIADFERTNFSGGGATFLEANFSEDANFKGSKFNGDATFVDATFDDKADFGAFRYSTPPGIIVHFPREIGGVQVNGIADFFGAEFNDDADFSTANFIDDAIFTEAEVSGDAYFGSVKFGSYSVFSEAQFFGDADFRYAEFSENAYFENTYMNTLYANETKFNRRVLLSWKPIQRLIVGDYNREIAFYLDLMENYKKVGWFGDFNNCYYEYRNICRTHNVGVEKVTDTLEWILYGYGVKPYYTLTWIALFVLIFGMFFRNGGNIKKYISEEQERNPSEETAGDGKFEVVEIKTVLRRGELTFIDPFLFSLTTFTSGFTSFLYPSTEYRAEKHKRLVILERLLGSVFLALLITAIGKTYLIR